MMEYIDKIINQEWIDKIPEDVLDMDVTEFLKNTELSK